MLDEEQNQQDFAINEEIIEDHTDLMQVSISTLILRSTVTSSI